MGTPAAVSTVGAAEGSKFVPVKMFTPGPAMPAPAKNPDLVDKIAFFQN